MPFQVSLCVSSTQGMLGLSVPKQFISPCATSLTLTATIISGRSDGHAFLWEVTAGAQVVFTSPTDQLSTTLDLPTKTDRVFTFWVDKGTSIQQRFDFRYYATSTEIGPFYGGNTVVSDFDINVNWKSPLASIFGTVALTSGNTVQINPSTDVLFWGTPLTPSGLVQYLVQHNVDGIWTDVATVAANQSRQYSGVQNHSFYRIVSVYILDKQTYYQPSSPYFVALNEADYSLYGDDVLFYSGSNAISFTQLTNFNLVNTDSFTNELVDINLQFGGVSCNFSTVNYFTLLSTDSFTNELADMNTQYGSSTANFTSVVYFGGTVIGG